MKSSMLGVKIGKLYEKFGILAILLVELLIFSLLSENFFTVSNLLTVVRQTSFTGVAAVGATLLMLTGGIDISAGSMLAFSGVICATMTVHGNVPLWLAILITLIAGAFFGALNGVSYAILHVSPLIATLAMQTVLKGISFIITGSNPIYGIEDAFKFLGQGYVFGIIPFPIIIMLVMFLFGYWLLHHTYLGRYIYAVGGNAEAARLSGINNKLISIGVFSASGLFAALAGIMMAGRLGSGQPSAGQDFSMDVITAVVLGGVSINGGSGKIMGVLLGTIIMGVLSNGMVLAGLSEYWQWIVKGIVLVFAVAMSNINKSGN